MNALGQRRCRRPSPKRLSLVVLETGSALSSEQTSNDADGVTAIAQQQGEPPLGFARRVLEQVATVERSGRRFQSAVMLLGYRGDSASTIARRVLAHGLAAHGARANALELSLRASLGATDHARDELLNLVEELASACGPRAKPIRLHLGAFTVIRPCGGLYWNPTASGP